MLYQDSFYSKHAIFVGEHGYRVQYDMEEYLPRNFELCQWVVIQILSWLIFSLVHGTNTRILRRREGSFRCVAVLDWGC